MSRDELPQGSLNKDALIPQLQDAIDFMLCFCNAGESMEMANFKKRFSARYEQQEVPLIEALDTELGIGFYVKSSSAPNPLLNTVSPQFKSNGNSSIQLTPLSRLLLKKLVESGGSNIIELGKDDLKDAPKSSSLPPVTMAAMFSIVGIDKDSGDYKLKGLHFFGSSAGNMLGRFAGGDVRIYEITKQVAIISCYFHKLLFIIYFF